MTFNHARSFQYLMFLLSYFYEDLEINFKQQPKFRTSLPNFCQSLFWCSMKPDQVLPMIGRLASPVFETKQTFPMEAKLSKTRRPQFGIHRD